MEQDSVVLQVMVEVLAYGPVFHVQAVVQVGFQMVEALMEV